jgi:hypothetical protein
MPARGTQVQNLIKPVHEQGFAIKPAYFEVAFGATGIVGGCRLPGREYQCGVGEQLASVRPRTRKARSAA